MKIDKTRFLVLTSGLAAASAAALIACSSSTTKTDNPNNGTDSGSTDSGGNTDTGATGDGGGDAAVACLSDKGEAPFCTASGEGLDAGDDAATDGGGDGGAMESACPDQCVQARTYFKSDVAADIDKCLNGGTMSCEGTTLATCATAALAKTCDDATATTYCDTVMETCAGDAAVDSGTPFTKEQCVAAAKGLNDFGRSTFLTCVQEGSTSCGDCLATLTAPPI